MNIFSSLSYYKGIMGANSFLSPFIYQLARKFYLGGLANLVVIVRPLKAQNIPILVYWTIWLVRNKLIFSNISPLWNLVYACVLSVYFLIRDEDKPLI